ncbi:hypothetical protein [Streptomyces venezuelae]|uniref:hypothetical protein n=1 Tax=Streptomyces venezuelae TaxID=54571 RepID=UPI00123B07EF|nr:hypothetical protein [Streptomyces venezuelae]
MKVRLCVLALVCVVSTGCGAASGPERDDIAPPGYAREPGVPRVQSEADIPELPLARYELSGADSKRLDRARNVLQRQCMRDFGFDDFPLDPDTWVQMSSSFESTAIAVTPYGTLDLERARRWGYGFDPDRAEEQRAEFLPKGRKVTERERRVLDGPEAGESGGSAVNGRKVPKGGCSEEAERRIGAAKAAPAPGVEYVFRRTAEIDKAVAADGRVRRAFRDWSRCVEDRGFKRYASPARAFTDKAWRKGLGDGSTHRTERELGTAVADVECNRGLNVTGVWWAVTAEKQRAELRRNRSRYEAVRKDQDRVRAAVREVLGEAG